MEIKKVLIIFKTHLDVGFTDFAANVRKKYEEVFIPNAIKTAGELRKENGEAAFKWTTGSWLIYEYLKNAPEEKVKELSEAILNGDICWHGLPCTTHTELMDRELFEYGLSLSRRLDERFGRKTIAAKMTDVPGHTKAMIPLLKKAGIEFLHIGVNPASAVPEVPEIFRWQCDTGEKITVIYNGEYGKFTALGQTGIALYFAHTNDNLGGQTPEQVRETFAKLRSQMPNAELVAADLNDVALVLREIEDTLPVVTDEIGDSWIHGVGTDPKKVMQFRALERVLEKMPEGADKEKLASGLLLIPEHTWGLDEKTHLHDNVHYSRTEFEKHRNDENYKKMEASWREQRKFMYGAVDSLSDSAKRDCKAALDEFEPEHADERDAVEIAPCEEIRVNGCTLKFNEHGEIIFLSSGEKVIADEEHKLLTFRYEQFCYDDYVRFHVRYHRIEDDWAWQDFTKVGMDNAVSEHYSTPPQAKILRKGDCFIIDYTFPERAVSEMGAPKLIQAAIDFSESINIKVTMFGKPANRIAEALWVGFAPKAGHKMIGKLGSFIDPRFVISRGNRNLHATDFGVRYDELDIVSPDCSLVSPGEPHLVDFVNTVPPENEGVFFNLYNNVWGTNFPMWYDEDTAYRFAIKLR